MGNADASSARCREGRLRPLHRHELLLGLSVYASFLWHMCVHANASSSCSPCHAEYAFPWANLISFNSFLFVISCSDYAITHNLTPFVSMQNHYSLIYREEEREMFPTLKVCLVPLPPSSRC